MQKNKKTSSQKYLAGYFSLALLGALLGLEKLLSIPADPKNHLLSVICVADIDLDIVEVAH